MPAQQSEPRLDTQRHQSIFSPEAFTAAGHRVSVLGAGSLGQRISRHLSQLGISFDVFGTEQHVRGSSGMFGLESTNDSCTSQLRRIVQRDTGLRITSNEHVLEPNSALGNIVFLCSDDEASRTEIYRRIQYAPASLSLIIDIRTHPNGAYLYLLTPQWRWQVPRYFEWRKRVESIETNVHPVIEEYTAALAVIQISDWFDKWNSFERGEVPNRLSPQRLSYSFRGNSSVVSALSQGDVTLSHKLPSISVIGAGALGSRVGRSLAALGLTFELWDDDIVEAHNVPNQAYGLPEIGEYKCDALSKILQRDYGITPLVRKERFDGSQTLGNIIFVCPDNMSARSAVWQSVRLQASTSLVLEGRMGSVWGKVYTAFPRITTHLRGYAQTLHSDAVAAEPQGEGACQIVTSVGATAECIAERLVGQLLRWFLSSEEERRRIDHEMIEYLRPYVLTPRNFSSRF